MRLLPGLSLGGFLMSALLARSAALNAAAAARRLPASTCGRAAAALPRLLAAPAMGSRRCSGLRMAGQGAVAEAPAPPAPVPLPTNANEQLLRIRHSTAHVMAMAVQRLYKDARVTIGPWIEKGFYYDFDRPEPFAEKDLRRIKKEMDKIIGLKLSFRREELSFDEAKARIEAADEPYKLEILDSIVAKDPDAPITIFHIGEPGKANWWDLCAGPHVEHTGQLPKDAIELESIAGAYWRGDEARPMLQRIYGTAWESAEQLAEHKRLQDEAKRRDHRAIGKQLRLFSIQQEAGGGLVFWHPRGARVRRLMEDFWREAHTAGGYELLYTPHMASLDLWKTSGHFDFYADGMFDQMEVEGAQYQIKPMNCPFHVLTYKDEKRSYRDLPLRWAELGTVYRYERSGTLNGLFRVRGFTQDDAHIFCLPEQLADEIQGVLDLTETILTKFGFTEYEVMLSTRPDKAVGSNEIWDKATAALREALGAKGWEYAVDEGGGAVHVCRSRVACGLSGRLFSQAAAPFTAPRSTSRSATPSGGSGSVRRSSVTSTCRSGSASSTCRRTVGGSSRSCCTAPSSARSSGSSACLSNPQRATSPFGSRRRSCGCCPCQTTTGRTATQRWRGSRRRASARRSTPAADPSASRSRSPTRTRC